MLFVLIVIVFMYCFTCISFAIQPSGRKSAIKLIGLEWIEMLGILTKSQGSVREKWPKTVYC